MQRKKELELIHFQLTKSCNLRCYFCGQWGQKGFFSQAAGTPVTKAEWFGLAEELADFYAEKRKKPSIILWGGEPLCCEFFDELSLFLYRAGFPLGLITNGTMLSEHAQICSRCFHTIYLSVDGPEKIHDAIRGKGVFDKIRKGRKNIIGARIILMSVLTERTQNDIQGLIDALSVLEPQELILQQQIGMTKEEVEDYRHWMKDEFGSEAPYIGTWMHDREKESWLEEQRINVYEQMKTWKASFPVIFLPHRNAEDEKKCLSPYRHFHVSWNGDVMYCTDFYDFKAGNIRENSIMEIFGNERSEKFRRAVSEGKCPACSHCSWRNNETFKLEGQ